MKLFGKFEFLGAIANQSSKADSKRYYVVSLLQDVDVTKVYVNLDMFNTVKDIPKMTTVDVELDVNITKDRTYLTLVSAVNSKQIKSA